MNNCKQRIIYERSNIIPIPNTKQNIIKKKICVQMITV